MFSSNEIVTLTFTPDNPCNTIITSPNGEILYQVATEISKKTAITRVHDAHDQVIGTLEWREVLPDRVTVKGSRTMPISAWMKKSPIPFKGEVSFKDGQGRRYKWRGTGPGRSLELYSEHDKYNVPIASYTRTRRMLTSIDPITGRPDVAHTPGELDMLPRALEEQDLVVLTLLFQEKQYHNRYGTGSGLGIDTTSIPRNSWQPEDSDEVFIEVLKLSH